MQFTQSSKKLRGTKRKFTGTLLASAASAALVSLTARADVFQFQGGGTVAAPTSGAFSSSTSFYDLTTGMSAAPVSAIGTELDFNGSIGAAYTATQNLGSGTFILSTMQLSSMATVIEVVAANAAGNSLTFNTSSGNSQILFNGTGNFNITAPVVAGSRIVLSGTGTGNLTLSSGITGNGLADNYSTGTLVLGGPVQLSRANNLNLVTGAVVTATATIATTADGSTGNIPLIGTGLLQLRSISSSASSPDINFDSNDTQNSTANYGTQINVPVDLGSLQRYLWGRTDHNGVEKYGVNSDCVFLKTISGTGGMTFIAQDNYTGSATMETPFYLDASNTFTGPVVITRGAVYLGNNGALNQSNGLSFNPTAGNNAYFFLLGHNASISNLSSTGAGNAVIANVAGGTAGTAAATILVTENAATAFNGAIVQQQNQYVSSTLANVSQGSLSLTKQGPATLTLTGASLYNGSTNILTGSLVLGGNGSLGNTAINVATGAGFSAHPGTATSNIAGTLSLASGASFDMNDNAIGTANLTGSPATGAALSLAGSTLGFDVGFSTADTLAVTNAVSVTGTNTISIAPPATGVILNNTYNIITAGSVTGSGNFQFSNGSTTERFQIGGQGTTYTANLLTNSNGVQVVISGAITNFWKGSASSVWTGANWTSDQAGNNPTGIPTANSNVIFTVTGGGSNASMTTLGQDFSIGSLSFTSDASFPITIGGNNNLTIGAGGIAIASGTGGQTISTASLNLGSSQTWTNNGSQPFTVTAPITGSNSNLTLGGQGSFVLAASNSYGSTTIVAGTSVQVGNGGAAGSLGTGTVANNGTLTFDTSGSSIVAQGISGTGSITQAGSGLAMVNGPITASTVTANAGTLNVNGTLTTTGAVTTNNANISSGSISAGSITANGGGITVSGAATTTTGITLSNNAMMSTTSSQNAGRNNPIVINDSSVYQSSGTLNLLVSQSTAVGNIDVSGGGTLRLAGNGNSYAQPDLFFGPDHSGASYYGADITVGTLDLGSTQRYFVANSGHNTAAKYLFPSVGVDAYVSSNIIGTAGFNYMGNQEATSGFYAPLVLQGSNTFTGPVEVDSGSIYLYSSNAWNGQNQLTLNNSAGLGTSYSHFFLLGNNTTITNLASTGSTPGNTGIGNSNPYSSVQPGSYAATLTINQTTSTLFGGVINDSLSDNYDASATASSIYTPGSLSLAITGSGTLTLSGNSNYSGSTTVGNSTSNTGLALSSGASLGNTAVSVNTGAVFSPAPGSKIGFTTGSGNASLTLNVGSVLDMTAGGTSTAIGNFNIHEPAGNGSTLLYINNATIDINASTSGADTIISDGPASVSGSNVINIKLVGTGSALPATYNIIAAPGGLTGTFNFNNGTSTETIAYGSGTVTLGLINADRNEELTINGGAISPLNAYWTNATGTGLWSTGGNGTGATNFSNDSQGTMDPHYVPGNITNVIFSAANVGGASFVSTLGKDFTINSLEFLPSATGSITVAGANILTLNAGGITVDSGSASHQISTGGLVIAQDQTWTNNSVNPFTVTSNVSGGNLTIGGIGTVILNSSNNSYGITTINSGATLQLGNGGVNGNVGTGAIVDSGILAFNHPGNSNYNASSLTGTGSLVQAGPGILTIANLPPSTIGFGVTAGTLVLPSVNLANSPNNFVGAGGTLVSNGTLNVGSFDAAVDNIITIAAGGTLVSNGNLIVNAGIDKLHVTIAGSGTLVLNNSGGSITNPDFLSSVINNSAYGTGISAAIQLSAGTHYVEGVSGNNSYGQYGDGDLFFTGSLSGPGNLVLYGQPYNSQFELRLGADNSAWTGSLTITGGDIALTATNALTANNSVTFNTPSGVSNHGTTLVSALYLFGNDITIGSLSGTGPGAMYIRDGAATAAAMLTVDQTMSGTFAGIISNGPNDYYAGTATTGVLGITKTGPAALILSGANTYTGPTNVAQGQLIFARTGTGIQTANMPGGLNIGAGAVATFAVASNHSSRTLAVLGGLSLSGNSGAWTSKLDLGNNDMVVNNGSISTITDQVAQGYAGGTWNGVNGIVSAAAAADATHLTALGVIQNSIDGTTSGTVLYSNSGSGSLGLFDNYAAANTDVLLKYTYYGDANLDGKVDGSDYSLIDSSFVAETNGSGSISGWYNGDFNYDGIVNGSDYTLIDNSFNSQGAALSAAVAAAQVGGLGDGSPVPEPASLGFVGITAAGLLGRRMNRRR